MQLSEKVIKFISILEENNVHVAANHTMIEMYDLYPRYAHITQLYHQYTRGELVPNDEVIPITIEMMECINVLESTTSLAESEFQVERIMYITRETAAIYTTGIGLLSKDCVDDYRDIFSLRYESIRELISLELKALLEE